MRDMRLGRFKMSFHLLEAADAELLQRLSRNLKILSSERDLTNDCQNYVANHPDSEEVEMGQQIPEYVAIFTSGSDSVGWMKV